MDVEAFVEAGNVIVHGKIYGDVKARELLHVQKGGVIIGNIMSKEIQVERGGQLEGNIMMMK